MSTLTQRLSVTVLAAVGCIAASGFLAGCSDADDSGDKDQPSTSGSTAPEDAKLLLHSGGDSSSLAKVQGVVDITSSGCVGIDGKPIAVPPGSTFDGTTLSIAGGPQVRLGEQISIGGGYSTIDSKTLPAAADCGQDGDDLIVINLPTR